MRTRLQNIISGKIEYPVPKLEFGTELLNGRLLPGKRMSVDFTIRSEDQVPFRVYLFSDSARIAVPGNQASRKAVRVTLEISTAGLFEGDILSGHITVLYNGGSAKIPYHFTIGREPQDDLQLPFHTLKEFEGYEKRCPEEALKLFSSESFTALPFMEDLHLNGLYRGLYSAVHTKAAMQAFLKAASGTVEEPETGTDARHHSAPPSVLYAEDRKRFRLMRFLLAYLRYAKNRGDRRKTWFDNEIARLTDAYPKDSDVHLLNAYYHTSEGENAIARSELIRLQDQVQKERTEKKDRYCLFILLAGLVQNDSERMEVAKKLIHKYYMEGSASALLALLEYRTSPLYEQPEEALAFLTRAYDKGLRSPLFLQELAFLLEEREPDCPVMTEQLLLAVLHGLRTHILSERALFRVLQGELKNNAYLRLYMLILRIGYRRFQNISLLQAVCNVFLQQKGTGPLCHSWYREAISRGILMNGLYEYFLASMGGTQETQIPREVMRYFGLMRDHTGLNKDLLYHAAVTDYAEDEEISMLYREPVRTYGLNRMKTAEYSALTVPIIRTVMKESSLTEDAAEGMMEFFYVSEVKTSLPDIRRLVLLYPELTKDMSYPVTEGRCFVPVFSKEAILIFEDGRGFRHTDPHAEIVPVFSDELLKRRTAPLVQETLLLRLEHADRILREGVGSEEEAVFVRELSRDRRVSEFFRARLLEKLIECDSSVFSDRNQIDSYLSEIDYGSLKSSYQEILLKKLIGCGNYDMAYRRVLEYGFDRLDDENLLLLVSDRLQKPPFKGDQLLYAAAVRLYLNGCYTAEILSYLAFCYYGTAREMLTLLRAARKKHVPLSDLTERTLAVSFFTGSERDMDTLFEWYLQEEKREELLIRAYLILRGHEYFMSGRRLSETALREMRARVFDLPPVVSYALLSWFADRSETLSPDDVSLAEQLLTRAAADNTVLGCFGALSSKVSMPDELNGRVFIEYRDPDCLGAVVAGTIFPVRRYFHRTMNEVYPGVFTRSFVLYKKEWIQYYYSVHQKDGQMVEKEGGVVAKEADQARSGSRYEDIAAMEKFAETKDLRDTAELMKSLILKDGMIEELFH